MAKVIDITEKLNFEDKPLIKIRDLEIEVNDTAETVLKIMPLMNGNITPEVLEKALSLVFNEKDLQALYATGIKFKELMTVLEAAIKIVTGNDGEQGEAQTLATT